MERRTIRCVFIAVLTLYFGMSGLSLGLCDSYPDKPINLIVPWGAGGNADVQARILTKITKDILGQPFVVINKPGGGTVPGVMEALRAPADGYTLVWIAIPSVATRPYLTKTPYTYKDLTPIVNVSENSLLLYVKKDAPWKTMEEFLNHARKNSVNISCNGIGALPHLAAAQLAKQTGAKFKYLAYESSAHAVVALIGGHMEAALAHELQAFTHGEQIRPLAIFEPERIKNLPAVPTAKEQGYAIFGYVRDGVAIHNKAPKQVIEVLEKAFQKAMEGNEFKEEMARQKIRSRFLNSQDTLKLWMTAAETYSQIIKDLGLGEKK
ncbi:MAG: tripartite tricarboxylate transporter substrate binding protein [Thermodesulfobacteriota bacterium]